MFKRREALSLLQIIRELFWPSMGWVRAFKYAKMRIIRLSDSSHKIAMGLAIGTGISFTPIVGTHFVQAGLLAYISRSNLIASLIGTFVGNPWTFPFMWWAAMSFGSYLFGLFGLPASTALPEHMNLSVLWDLIRHDPLRIFLPWAVGGYLLCFLSIPLTYSLYYNMVRGAKLARKKARLRKARKVAKEITTPKPPQKGAP
ncbi:MAG: DUF2062 domain-containing protein [Bdellovibrionales bacterium]